jgi:dihydrofolate reductase
MSRVRYYCASSLDGYIAESDDTLDWLLKYEGSFEGADSTFEGADSAEGKAGYDAFYEGIGALVMGSVTYEFVLEHVDEWPYAGKPAWVLSSRDLPRPEGGDVDVRVTAAEVTDLIDEMLEAAGERDLWVVGGGNVASQFADNGLLDTVEVTLVPVVLGTGKPLFDRRLPGGPMQLLGARTYASGMVGIDFKIKGSAR